ncbi:hypothetical protein Tco_0422050 [Tanacetum coccineum]
MTLSSLEERMAATAVATCHGSFVGDTIQVGVEYGCTIKGCVRRLSSTAPSGALVGQTRSFNEDKGRQDVLLNLAFQFDDSCAVRDDLRKAYEKCNDISQESRALICTFLKESSEKDRKLHLSMYGKAAQLEKQMDAKLAWFQEKYSGRTHGGIGCSSSQADRTHEGIGCSSSQANCPFTEKDLHQLRMDEEALKEILEEEAMNKKAQ